MHAEIISIGDEITSGRLLDTNSQWLSQRLEELGVRVLYHTTVGDEIDAMAGVFRNAAERADIIIATGGLGPTADDLTREAVSKAFNRPLEFREDVLETVRNMFARRQRQMPESNRLQAYFPQGSQAIDNPNGTAPGIDITFTRADGSKSRTLCVPGVPAEMRDMWASHLERAVREQGGGNTIVRHHNINCFGAGESQIEEMLPDLVRRGRTPRVGITASKTSIILRITAEGENEAACEAAMAPTIQTIHECLGDLIFGTDDDQLQDAVGRLLHEKGKTLSVAEWGTGGMVSDWLASSPETISKYKGGLVIRDMASIADVLGVPGEEFRGHETADDADVVQRAVRTMASACRERFNTDMALAVGPFPAIPESVDNHETDAPPMYFALANGQSVDVTVHPFGGHPALRKLHAAKRALNIARLALLAES